MATALNEKVVLIKSGGELASGVAHRLFRSHFKLCLTDIADPQAVRRAVSFCEAVHEGEKEVEGVVARLVSGPDDIQETWAEGKIPLLVDPEARAIDVLRPDVVVDAILAKKNLGTKITDAPLVIGLGPGFEAGSDVHLVIETNRGHNLGRVIFQGAAEPNTGIPGAIAGVTAERVFRAPGAGRLRTERNIGNRIEAGETVGNVEGSPIVAQVSGIIRGLLRDGAQVHRGMKVGDIDPRGIEGHCYTISDKARAVAGGVLEAIMFYLNR